MNNIPTLLTMIEGLIRTPSVSSVDPQLDQGNRAVIDLLAEWLEDSGFAVWQRQRRTGAVRPHRHGPVRHGQVAT
jgi:acetylornithine deacetylase/succinyl-diaminopimelate desuccinylase-like protein